MPEPSERSQQSVPTPRFSGRVGTRGVRASGRHLSKLLKQKAKSTVVSEVACRLVPKAPAVRGGASVGVRKVAPAKGAARAGCGVVGFENGAPVGGSGKGAPGPGFTRGDLVDSVKKFSAGVVPFVSFSRLLSLPFVGPETTFLDF